MKLKTNLVLTSIALALGALSVRGQAVTTPAPVLEPAPTSSWTVTPAFVSSYMFRGVRNGGTAFEPNIEYDSGNLGLGVWMNFPMADKVPGVSDPEIDPYGYYTITLSDSASVVPGFTWYNYPNAESANGFYKSTFEPSVAFNYTVAGLKITPKVYYDMVLDGATYELNLAFAVPLKDLGTELDFAATLGTYKWNKAADNASPEVKNYGDYYLIGVSVPFALTKDSKLIVGLAYTEGSNNFYKQSGSPKVENTAAVGRGVISVSYAYTF